MKMKKNSWLEEKFLKEAKLRKRRIGIVILRSIPETIQSLEKAEEYADLIVIGPQKIKGLNFIQTKDDKVASERIVDLLKKGEIEGMVRGQLDDYMTHQIFSEKFTHPKNPSKAMVSFIAKDDQWLGVTSTSNYDSLNDESKWYEIVQAIKFYEEDLKIHPKIAILSTRRFPKKEAEFKLIEEIALRCERIALKLQKMGYDVKEYNIEYEKAVWEKKDLICPSIGIVANPWAKSLYYLGGWHHIFTPLLDQGVVYENTARNVSDWFWSIVSTAAWINRET